MKMAYIRPTYEIGQTCDGKMYKSELLWRHDYLPSHLGGYVLSYKVTRTVVFHKCVYCVYWSKISIQPMYVCLCKHLNHHVRPHDATLWNWPPCFTHEMQILLTCSTIYDTFLCIWEGPLCHNLILRVLIGWKSNVLCISASFHTSDITLRFSSIIMIQHRQLWHFQNYLLSLSVSKRAYIPKNRPVSRVHWYVAII